MFSYSTAIDMVTYSTYIIHSSTKDSTITVYVSVYYCILQVVFYNYDYFYHYSGIPLLLPLPLLLQ